MLERARAVWMVPMFGVVGCILPFDDLPSSAASTGDATMPLGGGEGQDGGTHDNAEATTGTAGLTRGADDEGAGAGSDAAFDLGAGEGDGTRDKPPVPNDGDCCTAAAGFGCNEPDLQDCVCAADPFCCTSAWDELCVSHVEILSCGSCDMPGPAGIDVSSLDCCLPHEGVGCADPTLARCVCGSDPFCCDVAWDQVCVDAIADNGCGDCTPPSDDATCCTPSMAPGCLDAQIELCVCAVDGYCCDGQWDELCTDELVEYGCGVCDPYDGAGTGGSTSGAGSSSGSSSSAG